MAIDIFEIREKIQRFKFSFTKSFNMINVLSSIIIIQQRILFKLFTVYIMYITYEILFKIRTNNFIQNMISL